MRAPCLFTYVRCRQEHIASALATVQSELAARGGLPFVGLVNNAGVTGKADPVRACTAWLLDIRDRLMTDPPSALPPQNHHHHHHQVEFLPLDYNRFAFDVNYFGPLAITKAFLPLIRENKGRIVNVSRYVMGVGTNVVDRRHTNQPPTTHPHTHRTACPASSRARWPPPTRAPNLRSRP